MNDHFSRVVDAPEPRAAYLLLVAMAGVAFVRRRA